MASAKIKGAGSADVLAGEAHAAGGDIAGLVEFVLEGGGGLGHAVGGVGEAVAGLEQPIQHGGGQVQRGQAVSPVADLPGQRPERAAELGAGLEEFPVGGGESL